MAYEERQQLRRRGSWLWSPWSETERVRQGDDNTDNLVVLTVSLAALVAIGVSLLIYFVMMPDLNVTVPGR